MSDISDYDRAISAYQFQVERYHIWMNYYSLFHGALLVALYSLENSSSNSYLPLIICLLGYIAGLCWVGTVVGNRYWINRWLEIIKSESNQSIYKKSSKNIEREKGLLSTQKIMTIFTLFVCIAWVLIACFQLKSYIPSIIAFVIFIITLFMYICNCRIIHS